jgi:hypothetical protein
MQVFSLPEVQVFFLHSSLYLPKCSLRSTLYSKRSALFLIVFLESKVVKSMLCTPIYRLSTAAPSLSVHIWPPLNLQKASKSALINGEVEGPYRRCFPEVPIDPHLNSHRARTRKAASGRYCACQRDDSLAWPPAAAAHVCETTRRPCIMPPLRTSVRRLTDAPLTPIFVHSPEIILTVY